MKGNRNGFDPSYAITLGFIIKLSWDTNLMKELGTCWTNESYSYAKLCFQMFILMFDVGIMPFFYYNLIKNLMGWYVSKSSNYPSKCPLMHNQFFHSNKNM